MTVSDAHFVYLVQGEARLVRNFFHLATRDNCEAIFLTYDEPLDEAIYFPNSTWAEGRNRLLAECQSRFPNFSYVIFCDDDVHIYYGNWDDFEQGLLHFTPKVAVPVVDRTARKVLPYPLFQVQSFTYNDEQMMAFHRSVVTQRKILPYLCHFDELHWWATCRAQQILTQHHYVKEILQFNFIRISNQEHGRYEIQAHDDTGYKQQVVTWCRDNIDGNCKDINKKPGKGLLLLRTLRYLWRQRLLLAPGSFGGLRTTIRNRVDTRQRCDIQLLKNWLDEGLVVAVYGYGSLGKQLLDELEVAGTNTSKLKIVDKAAVNKPYVESGKVIESPEVLTQNIPNKIYVASLRYWDDIEIYLTGKLKLPKSSVYFHKDLLAN